MKRLIALIIALMLCAMPALAELPFTEDVLEDGSPIFYFEELSLTLPVSWAGKVMAVEEESGTSFYHKASYGKMEADGGMGGGFLFSLRASVNSSFSDLPAYQYLGFSEASMLNYFLELPTDYQAYVDNETIRAEYDAMFADVKAFAVKNGVSFYADTQPETVIEADSADSGDTAQAQAAAPTLEATRYHFEHNAVPRYFYDDPANMLEVLSSNGIYRLWTALADENNVAYPYQIGDFDEYWYDSDDGTVILQVVMPQPEATPQCYRLYMIYNSNTAAAGYYTVEYDNMLGESAFLCGWDASHNHINYGGAAILDANGDGYEAALLAEAEQVATLAGVSSNLAGKASPEANSTEAIANLAVIECPELGFTTMADPAYSWDYQEGTGISIYTENAGSIPYVIVWRGGDLIAEPLEYIKEQYTPHVQEQYWDDLVGYVEYEFYDIGGKQLPAGLYTYRLQGYLIDMLRVYDSTSDRTVVYTAKYIQDQGEATLAALDTAIRNFKAD